MFYHEHILPPKFVISHEHDKQKSSGRIERDNKVKMQLVKQLYFVTLKPPKCDIHINNINII